MPITLSEAKAHLRVDQSDEDSLIQIYIDASVNWIENFINQRIPGWYESPTYVPSAIKAAGLLIVGGLYENRESHGAQEVKENPAVSSLLQPYRIRMGI